MTIVVAGHDIDPLGCHGIFFAGDSGISDDGKLLVAGFKKVFRYPIIVKRPNIVGGQFRNYVGSAFDGGCAIAFAGSTLVAQQLMNSIGNHLSSLYATHDGNSYRLAMPCEAQMHLGNRPGFYEYDDEMFERDFVEQRQLIDGDFVAGVVQHAIAEVFRYATQYAEMQTLFRRMNAEFILALRCYRTNGYRLFKFDLLPQEGGNPIVQKREILRGTLAIIGLQDEFGDDAQEAYNLARASGVLPGVPVAEILAKKVQDKNDLGIFTVCGPCILSVFTDNELTIKKRFRLHIPEAARGKPS
ncbi:hypothetical protein LMG26846_00058 [Achromobacter insuavis]|uniref:hypothetical protein n=1 Tax=Achromobacter insuavis TaxID=1287735 RepID=UPI0014682514|nr:hypothetical protein [Achromobacter insuavis]CAB3814322.1 hypothetical protein LMG26846_00058 [Achromobacter insuavis]